MSKFSVGQRVRLGASWDYNEDLSGYAKSHTGTIVDDRCGQFVVRLDTKGCETPRIQMGGSTHYRDDGWVAYVEDLTPLPSLCFSVNDKVTIKRVGIVGTIDSTPTDEHPTYVVRVDVDGGSNRYIVGDDDLDPYVEPAPETPDDDNRELIAFIEGRMAKGHETYGHGVRVDDGNAEYDWLVMALEEVADQTLYLAAEIIRLKRLRGLIVGQAKASRIDSHYIAVARELATMNGWTITNALDALVVAGFATAFYNDPDAYLSDEPRELAKTVDEKRKGAR